MQKYLKILALTITAALMGGCSWFSDDSDFKMVSFPVVYKINIQQGNIITQDMINQLKPGMTRSQVAYVMGTPLLPDSFDKDRWDYIYTLQPGGKQRTQQTLSLFFDNDKLTRFNGDFRPEINQDANTHAQSDVQDAAETLMKEQAEDDL